MQNSKVSAIDGINGRDNRQTPVSLSRPTADAAHRQHRLPVGSHPRRGGFARIAASRPQTLVGVHRRHERRGNCDHRQAARSCPCRDHGALHTFVRPVRCRCRRSGTKRPRPRLQAEPAFGGFCRNRHGRSHDGVRAGPTRTGRQTNALGAGPDVAARSGKAVPGGNSTGRGPSTVNVPNARETLWTVGQGWPACGANSKIQHFFPLFAKTIPEESQVFAQAVA